MGDIWHWLWFILLVVTSGERNDLEEKLIESEKTIVIRNAERNEMQLHIQQMEQIQNVSSNTIKMLNRELEMNRQRSTDILDKF